MKKLHAKKKPNLASQRFPKKHAPSEAPPPPKSDASKSMAVGLDVATTILAALDKSGMGPEERMKATAMMLAMETDSGRFFDFDAHAALEKSFRFLRAAAALVSVTLVLMLTGCTKTQGDQALQVFEALAGNVCLEHDAWGVCLSKCKGASPAPSTSASATPAP